MSLGTVFFIVAAIFFFLAALDPPVLRGRGIAIGLLFLSLGLLLGGIALRIG